MKSLQKEENSTNLLLWPPIYQNKPAITPKWFNYLDTNSIWVSGLTIFFILSFKTKMSQGVKKNVFKGCLGQEPLNIWTENLNHQIHRLWTPGEEISFTAQPKINSHSQIFRFLSFIPALGVHCPWSNT